MKVFLVAPNLKKDPITNLTLKWAEELNHWLKKRKDLQVVPLLGDNAIQAKVHSALEKEIKQDGLFIFIDHGTREKLLGSNGDPIIELENIDLLKNKFIYAVACKAASMLGHEAVRKGAKGYIGYNDNVHIISRLSIGCGKSLLSGVKFLLENKCNAALVRKKIVENMDELIDKIQKLENYNHVKEAYIITALRHNRDYLVHLGDPDYSFQ